MPTLTPSTPSLIRSRVASGENVGAVTEVLHLPAQDVLAVRADAQSSEILVPFVTDIVRQPVLDLATHGAIQYHPSLLPRHRGRSSMNWPIIAGEAKTGLSIFWVDAGVDTGPILLQREIEIGPDDTLGTIYFGNLYQMGVTALVDAMTDACHTCGVPAAEMP